MWLILFNVCVIVLNTTIIYFHWRAWRPKKRSRAIPKGTEGARRGRKPKADSMPEKKPIPAPGPALPMV